MQSLDKVWGNYFIKYWILRTLIKESRGKAQNFKIFLTKRTLLYCKSNMPKYSVLPKHVDQKSTVIRLSKELYSDYLWRTTGRTCHPSVFISAVHLCDLAQMKEFETMRTGSKKN